MLFYLISGAGRKMTMPSAHPDGRHAPAAEKRLNVVSCLKLGEALPGFSVPECRMDGLHWQETAFDKQMPYP